jgi:hypothetical protein
VFAYDSEQGQYARIEGKHVPVRESDRKARFPWS